jgi:hypothetical protein
VQLEFCWGVWGPFGTFGREKNGERTQEVLPSILSPPNAKKPEKNACTAGYFNFVSIRSVVSASEEK